MSRAVSFVTYVKLGNLAQKGGDFSAARGYFEKGLEIVKPLSEAEPDDASLRSDLFVSYTKLGEMAQKGGDLPAARDYFGNGLAVIKALLKTDTKFLSIQRDLSQLYACPSATMEPSCSAAPSPLQYSPTMRGASF